MNFFEHQEQARRRTSRLVLLYVLAVVLIFAAVYLVVWGIFAWGSGELSPESTAALSPWNPDLFLWVTLGVGALILSGTLYKIAVLSAGGEAVAQMLGGTPVAAGATDPLQRRLLNVVEEMAIASGIPVPRVFLLADEQGINAFAAGFSPKDAVIGVTTGCLQRLTRDELQGVIAHEFSHILNGDMRLNLRLMGVLHGILLIALIGYGIFRVALHSSSSRGNRKGGGALPLILLGIGLVAVGYIGVFFAKLIKSAVSRQREYLADASSVQFTRNPGSISGALKKIGAAMAGSTIQNSHAEEASHLFFANGLRSTFLGLLATHPPLPERIRRIDPTFTGDFKTAATPEPDADTAPASRLAAPPAARRAARSSSPPPLPTLALTPTDLVASVGAPLPEHLAFAAALLAGLPADVHSATRDPALAQALVFALLLAKPGSIRDRQLARLETQAPPHVTAAIPQLLPLVDKIPPAAHLPLADLALAGLRALAAAEAATFHDNLLALAAADEQIDLFEYALTRMMLRNLEPLRDKSRRIAVRHLSFKGLQEPLSLLLSTLAHYGNPEPADAEQAFRTGCRELPVGLETPALAPARQCSLEQADHALDEFARAAPRVKQALLAACTACVSSDGRITLQEYELLRAIADSLDCPIPPLLPDPAQAAAA